MSNADAFTAIADPHRRFLLEELRRAPRTVNELAEGLPISRPAVSQHLKALLDRLNLWLDQFWA
jgi:DNA-binding transcriptional ArsR family regulator